MAHLHIVIMGVAGSGKSTVAEALRDRLGWPLAEGDDLHPESNVAKMASGIPLTDEDRWPWLRKIAEWMSAEESAGASTIVTCSALKRAYRDRLREAPGRVVFVHLAGSEQVLAGRLSARKGHFMPPSLLPSQLDTLEKLGADEDGLTLPITQSVDEIVDEIVTHFALSPAESHLSR